MPDYATMYKELFHSQTKAIQKAEEAVEILKEAQQVTENMYINAPEVNITVLDRATPEDDTQDGNE